MMTEDGEATDEMTGGKETRKKQNAVIPQIQAPWGERDGTHGKKGEIKSG